MKKFIFCLLIITQSLIASRKMPTTQLSDLFPPGKPVRMKSEKVLRERFVQAGFQDFADKTKIAANLGDQELPPLVVSNDIEMAFFEYEENLKKLYTAGAVSYQMVRLRESKETLLEILLRDHPDALEDLRKRGILPTA